MMKVFFLLLFSLNSLALTPPMKKEGNSEEYVKDSSLLVKNYFDQDHSLFEKVLKKFVTFKGQQSLVNYKDLKENPLELSMYLDMLSKVSKKQFEAFSKEQQLAFLINAYNAFTLKLIILNYPLKSIKDIGSVFSSPWKKDFFTLFGKKTNLDHIEHDLIRKKFKEPRIHFAVNCASLGCPSLQTWAYTAANLDEQLERASAHFLNNSAKNRFDGKKLFLSQIFKWYGDDFKAKYGSYILFTGRFYDNKVGKKTEVEWLDYDWNLNEWKN